MSSKDVAIERTLKAPLQKVWDMWTIAENFQKWYGPTGATIPKAEMDVRVGGKRHITMTVQTNNGPVTMYFTGEYMKIEPMTHLEYTEVIADEDGNHLLPSAMGMPGDTPSITTVVVQLTDLNDKTKLVLTHIGVPSGSRGESGWHMALDKLATVIR